MFSGNFKRRIGKHGRIFIPIKLRRNSADFKNKVIIVGCKDHIEVWNEEQWAGEQSKIKKTLDKINQ